MPDEPRPACGTCGRPRSLSDEWLEGTAPAGSCYTEGDPSCLRAALDRAGLLLEAAMTYAKQTAECIRLGVIYDSKRTDRSYTDLADPDYIAWSDAFSGLDAAQKLLDSAAIAFAAIPTKGEST